MYTKMTETRVPKPRYGNQFLVVHPKMFDREPMPKENRTFFYIISTIYIQYYLLVQIVEVIQSVIQMKTKRVEREEAERHYKQEQ